MRTSDSRSRSKQAVEARTAEYVAEAQRLAKVGKALASGCKATAIESFTPVMDVRDLINRKAA